MKRSISGIIRSELATIENLQFNGYDLGAILQYLKDKHEMAELTLNTLIVSLYRARKKHLKLGIQTKKLAKEINLNLEIPKKTLKIIKNPTIEETKETKEVKENKETKEIAESLQKENLISAAATSTSNAKIEVVEVIKQENNSKLLIKQVRDIFKSKTDISDLI